jgi:hypothetical protein
MIKFEGEPDELGTDVQQGFRVHRGELSHA